VTAVLIRFSKRLAIWEPGRTPDEIQQSEFRKKDGTVDLRPSVYEIQLRDIVQAFAEHASVYTPPASTAGIDVAGLGYRAESTAGHPGFAFIRAAHRELPLRNADDLFDLIRKIVASLTSRKHPVTRAEIVTYAAARLAAKDEEWQQAVTAAKCGPWVHKLASAQGSSG
jgi:hypothetical protein